MDELVKDLRKQGFTVVRTGSGHWKVSWPGNGARVIMAFSPSSTSLRTTIKRLRGLGYRTKAER